MAHCVPDPRFIVTMLGLPTTATAPFCPSEVHGTIRISGRASFTRKLMQFCGPALLVSVGYMDPGNWATDIEAGSRFGDALLWVVVASSLAAIVLQALSARVGIATGLDLAQLCRARYGPVVRGGLWILAELSIVACDLAEVLGGALAFHLLLGVPLLTGVALTAFDTAIVLGLKGRGFRSIEAIVLALILTIGVCLVVELIWLPPDWAALGRALVPDLRLLKDTDPLHVAIGIVGATVMPHNLYLHSSVVQTRVVEPTERGKREAIALSTVDTVVALALAMVVNVAILVLASQAFHAHGHEVAEIQDAYRLLAPIVGSTFAATLFGIALLAAGQSSTLTGTIAGQVLMEGFLRLKIPCWQRRLITRALALVPAFIGIGWLGERGIGPMLVGSQVVLSLQLPFAIFPMLRIATDRSAMGPHVAPGVLVWIAWGLFAAITIGNGWLLAHIV